ncbi:DNA-binding response regulator [Bacillus clarus]|uniref:Bacterial regulatory s, luxR family protein n=1 Tax=Bacillus clarus TaxID=2338372 RepID=A0A090YWF7_9BACI|nr:response regulator transcription factor [Bacillus clarus]KFN03229.1 bacterial regulatory s, luxR family protein [Bacillus clarus]RFT64393.1 DNA-binding response regulator [Bacillus clarus]
MIKVLIAEDQKMLRGALVSLLKLEKDMKIVADVSNGKDAWDIIIKEKPDVCLLDIEIPDMTGLEIAKKLRHLNHPCKIIIVTTFARPGYLQKAIDIKVDAYLLKDEPIDILIHAIRKVMTGEHIISTSLASTLFSTENNPLTEREREILRMVNDGNSTKKIGQSLFLTNGTVRNYLSSAIQKLEADSRFQAIQIAIKKGWL